MMWMREVPEPSFLFYVPSYICRVMHAGLSVLGAYIFMLNTGLISSTSNA